MESHLPPKIPFAFWCMYFMYLDGSKYWMREYPIFQMHVDGVWLIVGTISPLSVWWLIHLGKNQHFFGELNKSFRLEKKKENKGKERKREKQILCFSLFSAINFRNCDCYDHNSKNLLTSIVIFRYYIPFFVI